MHRLHVVIGGYGRVGRYLARMLEFEGNTVSVIDQNPLVFDCDEGDEIMGQKFVGPVFDRDVLEDAGIRDADCFAAVTSGDNSNIVAARTAKEYFRVPRVIARIYDPRRAEIYRGLGISTIASVTWTSTRLLDMVTHPDLHSEYQYGNAEVELMEVEVPAGARRQGRTPSSTCPARSRSRRSFARAARSCPPTASRSRPATPCSSTCCARAPASSSGCSG